MYSPPASAEIPSVSDPDFADPIFSALSSGISCVLSADENSHQSESEQPLISAY